MFAYCNIAAKQLVVSGGTRERGMAVEIGQKAKVRRLRDRTSDKVIGHLGKTGTVRQFKMVDGSGVGVVLEFDDGFSTWFFEDELQPL